MVLMPLPPSLCSSSVRPLLHRLSCLPFLHLLNTSYICQVVLRLPTIPHSFSISSSSLPPSLQFSPVYPLFPIAPLFLHHSGFPTSASIFPILLSSSTSPLLLLLHLSFLPVSPLPQARFLHFTHHLNPPFIPLHHPSTPSSSLCFPSVSLTLAAPSDPAITGAPGYHKGANL